MPRNVTYQVWALYPAQSGTPTWHPVTKKYNHPETAQNIAAQLWLETRIDVEDADEGEPGAALPDRSFEGA